MKNNKKIILWIVIIALIVAIAILGYFLYKKNNETQLVSENLYNNNFYELLNYVQNVETYLAKATISKSSSYGAETLTYLWREANLAQTYLARLPIESQELEKTEKFLNQVSDYSYSLSRKNIKGEDLSEEEIKNLKDLHSYSIELENVLNQLNTDLEKGTITWKDLTSKEDDQFAQAVSTNMDVFNSLEENFHEYSGLIYDGAFSEHLTNANPKGLTGDEISEEDAKNKIKSFLGEENVQEISSQGETQNSSIIAYNFNVKTNNEENVSIAISKVGGHIVYSNCNREIQEEKISYEEAKNKAIEFLNSQGFPNMKETYYLNENGIVTINFAYSQDDVVIYPDLIKVKIALDNSEIMGFETTGYLNNHTERTISKDIVTIEKAKQNLSKSLNIQSEGLAIIPTEYQTEILCYEFKGKVEETEFLVYVNAQTGVEEDILVIYNTPNGTLTM